MSNNETKGQIFCPKCGKPSPATAKFCISCGAHLTKQPKRVLSYISSIFIFFGCCLLIYIAVSAISKGFSTIRMIVDLDYIYMLGPSSPEPDYYPYPYYSKEEKELFWAILREDNTYVGTNYSFDSEQNIVANHRYSVLYTKYAFPLIITGIIILTGSIILLIAAYRLWRNKRWNQKLILFASGGMIIFTAIAVWVVKVPVIVRATPAGAVATEEIGVYYNTLLALLGEELFIDGAVVPVIFCILIFALFKFHLKPPVK